VDDVYDVLVGDGAGWDVPSRIPRLLAFAVFGVPVSAPWVTAGLTSLWFAWRALEEWAARRGR
jgi:hypothetical protein